ncbi:MAG: type II toxin-antitoxin system RelE/ParE family toxin [Gammaproteobacteria bacterium]|nr:type II toxin-antitoxin system RelE/ParE family toxin [Gammaproteobacteria bacterium]
MPRVIVTENAAKGLERRRVFLSSKSLLAVRRAAEAISDNLALLEKHPDIGRPVADMPELRELIIKFGVTGYVALYRYLPKENQIYLLAFRHQKEVGCEYN